MYLIWVLGTSFCPSTPFIRHHLYIIYLKCTWRSARRKHKSSPHQMIECCHSHTILPHFPTYHSVCDSDCHWRRKSYRRAFSPEKSCPPHSRFSLCGLQKLSPSIGCVGEEKVRLMTSDFLNGLGGGERYISFTFNTIPSTRPSIL